MRRLLTFSLAASLTVFGVSCSDFLSSDKVKLDPNNPSTATANQLFIAVQAAQFAQQEGIIALIGCMWMQQCVGTSNFLQTLELYNIASEDTPSAAFSAVYEGGGLVDIRKIEAAEAAAGDKQYLGIVQVWEVLNMAVAADIWGDVPYREAVGSATTPHLDPQGQIYADLQALLDQAITNLGGAGPGPGALDLVYGGNTSNWIDAANTIYIRLLNADSTSRDILAGVATGLYRTGAYSDAVRAFQRVGNLSRGEEDLRYYKAVSLYETGRYDDARKELACALPYIPLTEDVTRYRNKIEQAGQRASLH